MSVKSVLHSPFFAPSNAEASRVCELRSLASESRCADSRTMKPVGRAACCAIPRTCQPTSAPRLGAAPARPPPSPPARPLIPPAPRLATERCIVRAHALQRPSERARKRALGDRASIVNSLVAERQSCKLKVLPAQSSPRARCWPGQVSRCHAAYGCMGPTCKLSPHTPQGPVHFPALPLASISGSTPVSSPTHVDSVAEWLR